MKDVDLVEVLKREILPRLSPDMVYRTEFKTRGAHEWRGACPFHGGKNPSSFRVDPVTLGFQCFGECKRAGSVVDGINNGEKATGREWMEGLKALAALAGVSLPSQELTPERLELIEKKTRRAALLDSFFSYAQGRLQDEKSGAPGRDYLRARGFEELEFFGLFTAGGDFLDALKSKGFSEGELIESGLWKTDKTGGLYFYDSRWAGRVIIPWRDRWGYLGTLAARDVSGAAAEGEKYLYLKGRSKVDLVAFGLDVAARNKKAELVLVEGLLDAIKLWSHGFNAAALGGTGTSPEIFREIFSLGFPSLSLVFDNDTAGREAILKALENVYNVRNTENVRNVPVYVVSPDLLEPFKDPEELIRDRGGDYFREVMGAKKTAEIYHAEVILGDVTPESSEVERQRAAWEVGAFSDKLRGDFSAYLREDLLHLTASRTGYSLDAIIDGIERHGERRDRETRERELGEALRSAENAMKQGGSPFEIARGLRLTLDAVETGAEKEPPPFSVDALEEESRKAPEGLKTFWPTLDVDLGLSFDPGSLSLVAGRTGHGKSSFLFGLLFNWLKQSTPGEFFVLYSMEEPRVSVYRQLLSWASETWTVPEIKDFHRAGFDSRDGYEWQSARDLEEGTEILREWESRVLVVFEPSWSADKITKHARGLLQRRNVTGVFIDYLQRIPPPPQGRYDRRDNEVSITAREFKRLAVDVNAPVIAGCQVNREAVPPKYRETLAKKNNYEDAEDTIKGARPELYHLREGGAEQEGDLVLGLLLYAADYREDTERSKAPEITRLDVGVLKNRYGEAGKWTALNWKGKYKKIIDPKERGRG